ncbi:unnamed protein product [Urochloa humidicola]
MTDYCPPGFPYCIPPPSRWPLSPPPPPPFHPTPRTSRDNSPVSPGAGGVIAPFAISVGVFLLVLTFVCSLRQGYCKRRANAASSVYIFSDAIFVAMDSDCSRLPCLETVEFEIDLSRLLIIFVQCSILLYM